MDSKEFRALADKSGLNNIELGKVLGVGRGTIHNYLTKNTIPSTKEEFIREVLSKDKEVLRYMIRNNGNHSVNQVLPFVVTNFEEFMKKREFADKVYIEAYSIAEKIINRRKEEILKENQQS